MKRALAPAIYFLIFCVFTILFVFPAALRGNMESALKKTFPHEKVSVGRCRWHWPPALSIESLQAGKLHVEGLRAGVRLSGRTLSLQPLFFRFLGQPVTGRATVLLQTPLRTDIHLSLATLPVSALLETMDWDKKLSVKSLLTGDVFLAFEGDRLADLRGNLASLSPGGDIVILDQEFLRQIAERAKQPLEIVKASFENYHYNTGIVSLSLADEKVRLGLHLDGEQGKRDLEVTLHDFI